MSLFKIFFPAGYQVRDIYEDNIDVNIVLPDNSVYFGTLFTISNIQKIMVENQQQYFWSTDMVIINDLSKESINLAIKTILDDGYFDQSFSRIGTVDSVFSNAKSFDELS